MKAGNTAADLPQEDLLARCLVAASRQLGTPISPAVARAGGCGNPPRLDEARFVAVAEANGLVAVADHHSIASLPAALLPAVLWTHEGIPLLALERSEGRWRVLDPGTDPDVPVELDDAAMLARCSGRLVALARAPVAKEDDAGQPPRRPPHWFWSAFAGRGWLHAQILLAATLTNLLGLTSSLFIMVVYDRVVPNEAIETLLALSVGVLVALGFDFAVKSIRASFIDATGRRADVTMGRRIFDHLLAMRLGDRRGSVGAFASTLREFESLREFFASASVVAIVDVPFVLLFLFVIQLIGGPLAIVPMLAVPVVIGLGLAVQPLLRDTARAAAREGRSKQGVLVETITGLETIKATGAAPFVRARWEESIREQSAVSGRGRAFQQFLLNATASTQQLVQIAIVIYGVFLIRDGVISMGAMIACVILSGRALAPLSQLAQTLSRLNQARNAYDALDRLMAQPTERPAERQFLSRPRLAGRLSFRDVSFAYGEQQQAALNGVSFTVEAGEHVAIIGRIGSGKSTVSRLALGIHEASEGTVLVDGTDLRQIDPVDLRANIGAVLQDPWLFDGTVRDNILVAAPDADDERLLAAARAAGADEFVALHPMGYDMPVGERGAALSGGQRQLLCLARALIADPPILLLDEPTSAMDAQTEAQLVRRLKAASADRTLLVITHRPSLLALVDRVIVLDGGRVVADGPREELLKQRAAQLRPERARATDTNAPRSGAGSDDDMRSEEALS